MTTHDRPTQAEIEALSSELTDRAALEIGSLADLLYSAALMIARLERQMVAQMYRPGADATRWRETD